MPSKKIGRYRVQRLLGQTDFGAAYLAYDDTLQRPVLIKTPMQLSGIALNAQREYMIREAQLLAQLSHPAIVKVFDIGEHEGWPFIAIELVDGTKLNDILATAQMTLPRRVGLIADVADGVHFLHRRGYFHLHLKPENILVDSGGDPRIDGFSFAISEPERLQQTERNVGTPIYMAPEQVAGNAENVGTHTDVWALGVILYEAFTGHYPFSGNDISSVFHHVQNSQPVSPRKHNASVPKRLEEICMKCLRKQTRDRYTSAAELRDDLRQWLAAEELARPSKCPLIFVSHSSSDREFVEREIVALLERNNMETWYSKNSIPSSTQWERLILKGLEISDWFLLVMSRRSAESEWVKDELHWAVDKCPLRITPIFIDTCEPRDFHIRLARIQHIDFREDLENARQNLLSTLRERCRVTA